MVRATRVLALAMTHTSYASGERVGPPYCSAPADDTPGQPLSPPHRSPASGGRLDARIGGCTVTSPVGGPAGASPNRAPLSPTPLRRATRRPPRQGGTALSRPSRPAWPLSLLFGLGDHMHAYRICVHAIRMQSWINSIDPGMPFWVNTIDQERSPFWVNTIDPESIDPERSPEILLRRRPKRAF